MMRPNATGQRLHTPVAQPRSCSSIVLFRLPGSSNAPWAMAALATIRTVEGQQKLEPVIDDLSTHII